MHTQPALPCADDIVIPNICECVCVRVMCDVPVDGADRRSVTRCGMRADDEDDGDGGSSVGGVENTWAGAVSLSTHPRTQPSSVFCLLFSSSSSPSHTHTQRFTVARYSTILQYRSVGWVLSSSSIFFPSHDHHHDDIQLGAFDDSDPLLLDNITPTVIPPARPPQIPARYPITPHIPPS